MSGGCEKLSLKEDDVTKMLSAGAHLGDSNVNYQMQQYIYKIRTDGTPIFNVRKTWEKLLLAARIIATVENPADICVISNGNLGQRSVLKFSKYVGCTPVAGRFTPGTFTNQIQKAFREPRLLVISDPLLDHQPITEASYVNIPVIAFCNSNAPLRFIDVGIPCNTNGKLSQGLMWWMLAREVLRLKGDISRDIPWEVVPDLFFYRDPEEVEKEEQIKADQLVSQQDSAWGATGETINEDQWGDTNVPPPGISSSNWDDTGIGGIPTPSAAIPPVVPTAAAVAATTPFMATTGGDQDWNMVPSTTTKDWGSDEGGDWNNTDTNVEW